MRPRGSTGRVGAGPKARASPELRPGSHHDDWAATPQAAPQSIAKTPRRIAAVAPRYQNAGHDTVTIAAAGRRGTRPPRRRRVPGDLVSSSTAKATFPWNPTNQAARSPADPPGRCPPARRPARPTLAARPAPLVTVERIRVRSAETTCGPNGTVGVSPGSGGLVTSDGRTPGPGLDHRGGDGHVQRADLDAARSRWCPRPARPGWWATAWSRRTRRPAAARACRGRSPRRPTAVPWRTAAARGPRTRCRTRSRSRRGTWPAGSGSGGSLVKFWPPTGFEGRTGSACSRSRPVFSSAAVETIVNAWPG